MTAVQGPSDHRRRERWTGYAPLDAAAGIRRAAAWGDVVEGFARWPSWSYLALEGVKNQYRRTVLGPWWMTLQTTAYVLGLALIFGRLLDRDLRTFLPYIAIGFITFTLLSSLVRSAATVFTSASGSLGSTRQPLTSLVLRGVAGDVLQFGHNLVIFLAFLLLGLVPFRFMILLSIPAALLIAVNGVMVALWLGPTVARFRDVGPLVNSILQVLVFFTPVFYRLADLQSGGRGLLLVWNPFVYLLDIFRSPLIGDPIHPGDWIGSLVITALNALLATLVFSRTRSRLPYWVN